MAGRRVIRRRRQLVVKTRHRCVEPLRLALCDARVGLRRIHVWTSYRGALDLLKSAAQGREGPPRPAPVDPDLRTQGPPRREPQCVGVALPGQRFRVSGPTFPERFADPRPPALLNATPGVQPAHPIIGKKEAEADCRESGVHRGSRRKVGGKLAAAAGLKAGAVQEANSGPQPQTSLARSSPSRRLNTRCGDKIPIHDLRMNDVVHDAMMDRRQQQAGSKLKRRRDHLAGCQNLR